MFDYFVAWRSEHENIIVSYKFMYLYVCPVLCTESDCTV